MTLMLLAAMVSFLLAGQPPAVPAPEALVRQLYDAHQPWLKKDVLSRPGFDRFFDPTLARLWRADQQCQARTKGVGLVDFDPVLDGQVYDDDGLHDLRVKTASLSASTSSVDVTFQVLAINPASRRHLVYRMINTPSGWRISDIDFGNKRATLRQLLSQPCE